MSYTESGPLVLVPQRALLDASSADVELTLAEPGAEMVGKLIAAIAIDLTNTASISYADPSGAQVHVFNQVGEAVWFYGATLTAWLKFSDGDVVGPASATDNELARFDGATGKVIQGGSGVTLSDAGFLSGLGPMTMDEVSAVVSPGLGSGTFWIKDDAPNVPKFTDDGGTDHKLAYDPTSATGDTIYRAASGALTALAVGGAFETLGVSSSGLPDWRVPPVERGINFQWQSVTQVRLIPGGKDNTAVIFVGTVGGLVPVVLTSILTVDITSSGAGGLDTGSEANSTLYYIYLITQAGGASPALILSTSANFPTLPFGSYLYYSRPLFAVANNASGDIQRFEACGPNSSTCIYQAPFINLLTGGTATSLTTVDMSPAVPDGQLGAGALLRFSVNNTSANQRFGRIYDGGGSIYASCTSNVGEGLKQMHVTIPTISGPSSSLRYAWNGSISGSGIAIDVVGWKAVADR